MMRKFLLWVFKPSIYVVIAQDGDELHEISVHLDWATARAVRDANQRMFGGAQVTLAQRCIDGVSRQVSNRLILARGLSKENY